MRVGTVGAASTGPDGTALMPAGAAVGTVGPRSSAPGAPWEVDAAAAIACITAPRVGWVGPVSCSTPWRGTGTLSVGTPGGVPAATTADEDAPRAGVDRAGVELAGAAPVPPGRGRAGASFVAGAPTTGGAAGPTTGMPMSVRCCSRRERPSAVIGAAPAPTAAPGTGTASGACRIVGGAGSRAEPGMRTVATSGRAAPAGAIASTAQVAAAASTAPPWATPIAAPSGTRWRGTAGGTAAAACSTMWASRPLPRASRRR